MKITTANQVYYPRGGSEILLFSEEALLKKKGHQVYPFSRAFPQNRETETSSYFLPAMKQEGFMDKLLYSFKAAYNRETGESFGKLLEHYKPDIVHAHNIYGALTTSILDQAKIRNIPAIMTLHDAKLICPSYLCLNRGEICEACRGGRFYNCMLKRCHKNRLDASLVYTAESYFNKWFKKYDSISYYVCPSRFLLNRLLENDFKESKVTYLSNFINVSSIKPAYTPGGYILFAGRLSQEKGIMTLLKAMKNTTIPLKIAGSGPLAREAEEFATENKLSNIGFEGYQSGDKLKDLLAESAFVIIPSEWYENNPMIVLEAFAHGKPVIGSDIGGIPEMVVSEETGLLFTPKNHLELSDKIVHLFQNSTLIEKLGRNARQKVEKENNPETHYKKLMNIYRKVLG